MIQICFLTASEHDAIELAGVLNQHKLLMFDTIEEHVDLDWVDGLCQRKVLTHRTGTSKALLFNVIERTALEVPGDRLLRMWAQPITGFDAKSTRELMAGLAKA